MSGLVAGGVRREKLLVLNSLSESFGNCWSAIDAEVNLLVQQAVFVTDDQPGFGVIFGNQQPKSLGIPGYVENEIRQVRFAGA
jgi:hypothetical protein